MSLAASWSVKFNGRDVTSRLNTFIDSIECSAQAGGQADSASLKFTDVGGGVILPPKNSPVEIYILGRLRFKGYTDSPRSTGGRGQGQKLEISCKGIDKRGKIKQPLRFHKDNCTLQEFLDEAAKQAGQEGIKLDPEFGKIKRSYWNTRGMNFLQLGQRLADELGGTFTNRGKQSVIAKRGGGTTPDGKSTPTVYARNGDNLVSWALSPDEPRQQFAKVRTRWYDRKAAKWKTKDVEVGPRPGDEGAVDQPGDPSADEDQAERVGKGRATDSNREAGGGTVLLDLTVEPDVEGTCIVEGTRDGIDGPYRIESWRIKLDRGGGENELTLKQPQGKAGTDSRRNGSGSGSGGGSTPSPGATGRNNDAGIGGGGGTAVA